MANNMDPNRSGTNRIRISTLLLVNIKFLHHIKSCLLYIILYVIIILSTVLNITTTTSTASACYIRASKTNFSEGFLQEMNTIWK